MVAVLKDMDKNVAWGKARATVEAKRILLEMAQRLEADMSIKWFSGIVSLETYHRTREGLRLAITDFEAACDAEMLVYEAIINYGQEDPQDLEARWDDVEAKLKQGNL